MFERRVIISKVLDGSRVPWTRLVQTQPFDAKQDLLKSSRNLIEPL